jgi:shikimate dehydrogenase
VPVAALACAHWVADVIYTPIETELIEAARAAGTRVLTGGGMCVHQAAETFRLFTGRAARCRAHASHVRGSPCGTRRRAGVGHLNGQATEPIRA